MTALTNTEFVSGTTITSTWLNGVNDALNNVVSDTSGTTARTLTNKITEFISVEDFGAVGDGVTDDVSKIQAALDAVSNAGGGKVVMQAKDYAVSSTVSIPSGVKLVGCGAGQYPVAAFITDADFIATPKTRIVALSGFAAATPVVQVRTANSAKYTHHSCGVEGIMIDCATIADYGLDVVSVKNSFFKDIIVSRANLRGILEDCLPSATSGTAQAGGASTITLATTSSTRDDLYNGQTVTITGGTGNGQSRTISDYVGSTQVATVSVAWTTQPDATSTYTVTGYDTTEGNNATQFNSWDSVTVYNPTSLNTMVGWVQIGNPSHNVNQSVYTNCGVVCWHGDALQCQNSDTNTYIGFRAYTFGKGAGVRLYGNAKNTTEYARLHVFLNPVLAGLSHTGTAQAGGASTITLSSGASTSNSQYEDRTIVITAGTGIGQKRVISSYDGTTKIATVSTAWTTVPDATSAYAVYTGGVYADSGAAVSSQDNLMVGYHTSDGSQEPRIASAVRFTYTMAGGASYGWQEFTPTVTFATPGDLSVSYTTQKGRWWRDGQTIKFRMELTFTPTHTTASGAIRLSGLPYTSKAASTGTSAYPCQVVASSTGWTWGAGNTMVFGREIAGTTYVQIYGAQSNSTNTLLDTTNFASGTAKTIWLTGEYEAPA